MLQACKAALGVVAVAVLTVALAAPSGRSPQPETPGPEAMEPAALNVAQQQGGINIVDFGFEPPTLTVNAGDSITVTNTGGRPHTWTDRGGTVDTDAIQPGANATIEFTVPGTYQFFCRINPGQMNGSVTVQQPEGEVSQTNRIQALDEANIEGEQRRFDPTELTVPAGSTIQFANVGGLPHTLTAEDGSFDTGQVPPGAERGRFAGTTVAFAVPNEPGEVAFRCSVHPQVMQGVLTIAEAAGGGGGEPPPEAAETPAQPPPEDVPAAPATAEVQMADFSFEPFEASVAPGGTVTWTNGGEAPHTATFDDVKLEDAARAALNTGTIDPGGQGQLTAPEQPGSYTYTCELHPGQMSGVLVVVAEGTADPTQQAAAAPPAPPAAGGGGGGGGNNEGSRGLSLFVLLTAVLGAFAGGLGLAALIARRSRASRGG